MDSSKETDCRVPDSPILCISNCGFFGSAATMNMCSKCYKDKVLKKQQAKLAASSIENIVKANSCINEKKPVLANTVNVDSGEVELQFASPQPSSEPLSGPSRCNTCRKRVGLTGFSCRCGHLFCSAHRHADTHDCQFDYRTTALEALAKANPVVKAEKLDKI